MKWTRVDVTDPIFTKGSKKDQALLVGSEWMQVRRYISPTAVWVERLSAEDQWVLATADYRTSFVEWLARKEVV